MSIAIQKAYSVATVSLSVISKCPKWICNTPRNHEQSLTTLK